MSYVFGGAYLPLTALSEGVFKDPSQETLLDFCAAVLNSDLAASWRLAGRVDRPVNDKLPWEPDENVMLQRMEGWPLLLVYRTSPNEQNDVGAITGTYTDTWNITWCLGPMTANDAMRLGASRVYALTALMGAFSDWAHPAYADGRAVLKSYFRSLQIKTWDQTNLFSKDGTMYPSLLLTVKTEEQLRTNLEELPTLDGLMLFQGDDDLVVSEA